MPPASYERYGSAGNDWGSVSSLELGRVVPDHMIGAHVCQAWSPPPDDDPAWLAGLSARDETALEAFQGDAADEASYGAVHGQQPQTLAHALSDSPVGLLGWNAHAMRDLDTDALHTHVTIHWLTNTAGSAIRIYAEQGREVPPAVATTVPVGVTQFPNDLASIRTFAEHQHTNIISWNHHDRGGHYAAHDARSAGLRHPPALRNAPFLPTRHTARRCRRPRRRTGTSRRDRRRRVRRPTAGSAPAGAASSAWQRNSPAIRHRRPGSGRPACAAGCNRVT